MTLDVAQTSLDRGLVEEVELQAEVRCSLGGRAVGGGGSGPAATVCVGGRGGCAVAGWMCSREVQLRMGEVLVRYGSM